MIKVKGWWYSAQRTDRVAFRTGTKHGKSGLDPMPDLVIKTRLPEVGPFDPARNEEHAEIERQTKPHPKFTEWEAGVRQAEKTLTKYPNRWLLRFIFLFLLGVEYAGINELLTGQGMQNPHRTIIAIAGASIFFYLTHVAAKAKRLWFYALLVGIALFVGSMALLWRDNTATDDTDVLTSWASAIFLVFVVCGPGLVARKTFDVMVPVEELAKNRRRLLREIKRAEAARNNAVQEKSRLQTWYAWYVQESNRMRSIYMLAYKEAGGKGVENPYVSEPRRTE